MRSSRRLTTQSKKSESVRSLPPPSEGLLRAVRLARGKRGSLHLSGRHSSHLLGFASSFETSRPYSAGDDLRFLNWRLLGRTERTYVKLSTVDATCSQIFVLDSTASMQYGGKFNWACRFAHLGAYVAYCMGDYFTVVLSGPNAAVCPPPAGGPSQLQLCRSILTEARAEGAESLCRTLARAARFLTPRRTAFILSDFISSAGDLRAALALLEGSAATFVLVHILTETERTFPFTGTVRFVDPESGVSLVANAEQAARAYRETLSQVQRQLAGATARRYFSFFSVDAGRSDPERLWQELLCSEEAKRSW